MKKNILIPYKKYEKLISQSKMTDMTDGQCISHNQHIELGRDKVNEYAFNYEKEKEPEKKAKLTIGLQKGEGGDFNFKANAAMNSTPPLEGPGSSGGEFPEREHSSPIRLSPERRQSYIRHSGPPGRRASKIKNRKKKWQTF